MHDGGELSLRPHGAKVLDDLRRVELQPVVKDHRSGNAEAGDDIFPNKLLDFCRGNGGDCLSLNPLGKIIHNDKEVFSLTRGLWKGSEYVYSPSYKW